MNANIRWPDKDENTSVNTASTVISHHKHLSYCFRLHLSFFHQVNIIFLLEVWLVFIYTETTGSFSFLSRWVEVYAKIDDNVYCQLKQFNNSMEIPGQNTDSLARRMHLFSPGCPRWIAWRTWFLMEAGTTILLPFSTRPSSKARSHRKFQNSHSSCGHCFL